MFSESAYVCVNVYDLDILVRVCFSTLLTNISLWLGNQLIFVSLSPSKMKCTKWNPKLAFLKASMQVCVCACQRTSFYRSGMVFVKSGSVDVCLFSQLHWLWAFHSLTAFFLIRSFLVVLLKVIARRPFDSDPLVVCGCGRWRAH